VIARTGKALARSAGLGHAWGEMSDRFPRIARSAIVAVGISCFALLAFGARSGGTFFDRPVLAFARTMHRPFFTQMAGGVTTLGNGEVLTAIAVIATLGLFALRMPWRALFVGTVASGAGATNELLKLAFARPRPEESMRLTVASGYSFPSGHAMASAAIFGALALVLASRFPRHRLAIVVAAALLVFAIGASRVYLCVHYPSDVLGGWLVGTAMAVWLAPLFLGRSAAQALRDTSRREP
jgi:membrane-associated phospholipid phosphatase